MTSTDRGVPPPSYVLVGGEERRSGIGDWRLATGKNFHALGLGFVGMHIAHNWIKSKQESPIPNPQSPALFTLGVVKNSWWT